MRKYFILAFGVMLFATVAHADDKPDPIKIQAYGDTTKASSYRFDTSVPAAPAFALVQKAPELSVSSGFGPDFASSISLVGSYPGFAVAVRPYWYFGEGEKVSLGEYRSEKSKFERILARSTLSLAAAPNNLGQNSGFGAAFGLHTELLDRADPRFMNPLIYCLGDAALNESQIDAANRLRLNTDSSFVAKSRDKAISLLLLENGQNPGAEISDKIRSTQTVEAIRFIISFKSPGAAQAFSGWLDQEVKLARTNDYGESRKLKVDACMSNASVIAENRSSFQVGIGSATQATTYRFQDMKYAGTSLWSALRIPIFPKQGCNLDKGVVFEATGAENEEVCAAPLGFATAFALYNGNDTISVSGNDQRASTSQAGLVLGHHNQKNTWTVAASAAWIRHEFSDAAISRQELRRYAISISQKVTNGIWIEANFGQTSGQTQKQDSFGLVQISFK